MSGLARWTTIAVLACLAVAGSAWVVQGATAERRAVLGKRPPEMPRQQGFDRRTERLVAAPVADRLDADARDAAVCRQLVRERSDPAAASTVAPGEPVRSGHQTAAACASRPESSDDDITSRLHMAAAAGSLDAQRTLLIEQLHQDESDVDALAAEGDVDQDAVRGYFDRDIRALREMALRGDSVAARMMASLLIDGRLVGRDTVAAAAWEIMAERDEGAPLPPEDILRRDPALEELNDVERDAALATVQQLALERHGKGPP